MLSYDYATSTSYSTSKMTTPLPILMTTTRHIGWARWIISTRCPNKSGAMMVRKLLTFIFGHPVYIRRKCDNDLNKHLYIVITTCIPAMRAVPEFSCR